MEGSADEYLSMPDVSGMILAQSCDLEMSCRLPGARASRLPHGASGILHRQLCHGQSMPTEGAFGLHVCLGLVAFVSLTFSFTTFEPL